MTPDDEIALLANRLQDRGLLDLAREVALKSHVLFDDMLSHRRTDELVNARAALWAELCRRGYSAAGVGRLFNRDHTTVLNCLGTLTRAKRPCAPDVRKVIVRGARRKTA